MFFVCLYDFFFFSPVFSEAFDQSIKSLKVSGVPQDVSGPRLPQAACAVCV